MKAYIITFSLLLTLISKPTKAYEKPLSQQAIFEVVLDSGIKLKPIITVYSSPFYESDTPLADLKEFNPVSQHINVYRFLIPANSEIRYFSLSLPYKGSQYYVINQFLFEQGDKITIHITTASKSYLFKASFAGEGVAKYICRDELKQASTLEQGTEILMKYQSSMSADAFARLKADMISTIGLEIVGRFRYPYEQAVDKGDSVKAENLKIAYYNNFKPILFDGLSTMTLYESKQYLQYQYFCLQTAVYFKYRLTKSYLLLEEIMKMTNTALRDRLLVKFFIYNWKFLDRDFEVLLSKALAVTNDSICRARLKTFFRNTKGQQVYNFSLPDMHGNLVNLSDFKGKIVFIDFFFTGCTACSMFYKEVLAGIEHDYKDNPNIVFMSISIDRDREQWIQTLEGQEYASKSGINLYTNGEGGTHKFIKYHNVIGYPSLLLIDRNGAIVKFSSKEMRTREQLLETIETTLAQ